MVLMSIEGLDGSSMQPASPQAALYVQRRWADCTIVCTAVFWLHNGQFITSGPRSDPPQRGGERRRGGGSPRGINPTPFCLCLYPLYHLLYHLPQHPRTTPIPSPVPFSIASSIAPMCDSKSNCCRLNYSGLHKGRRLFTIHLLKCIFLTGLTALAIGNINGLEWWGIWYVGMNSVALYF